MYRYLFSSGALADRLAQRHAQRKPVRSVAGGHQRRLEGMLTIEGSEHLHSASGSQNFRRAGHGQERCERTVFLDGSGERVIERLWSLVSGHLASLLSSEQDVGVETRVSAGVARGALLIDDQQDGIAVTVESHLVHVLGVPGGLTLDPVLLPRARIVRPLTGFQCSRERFVVHPRDHQHITGRLLLRNRAEQSGVVSLQLRRDCGIKTHMTFIPSTCDFRGIPLHGRPRMEVPSLLALEEDPT